MATLPTGLTTVTAAVCPKGILTLTLNRPKRKNAVNSAMYLDIIAVLKYAAENDAVNAVVLTGAGGKTPPSLCV